MLQDLREITVNKMLLDIAKTEKDMLLFIKVTKVTKVTIFLFIP